MVDFALTALASILFVVDPVGAVPGYLVLTEGDPPDKRRRTAWKASLAAAAVMAAFAAGGQMVFRLLGLTMPAFQIAGGVILFRVALDMLQAQRPTQEWPDELSEGRAKADVALTPLAIPMLAGPASLSTVATLMTKATSPATAALVYVAIGLSAIATGVTLQLAGPLLQLLGRTGIHVLTRLFGLLLAAIAVQFVLDGLRTAGAIPAPANAERPVAAARSTRAHKTMLEGGDCGTVTRTALLCAPTRGLEFECTPEQDQGRLRKFGPENCPGRGVVIVREYRRVGQYQRRSRRRTVGQVSRPPGYLRSGETPAPPVV